MKKTINDICIVGAGPAGLTAGLFASRRSLKTYIVAKDFGGQAVSAPLENYPGIPRISGFDFAQITWEQAKKYGCEQYVDEVTAIEKDEEFFVLHTSQGRVMYAYTVILTCGRVPRNLGVFGEKELFGKGVEYSRLPADTYSGLRVAIVGGGASAVQSAIVLSEYANEVYLIHRRDSFSAEAKDIEMLHTKKNIKLFFSSVVEKIEGVDHVEKVEVRDCATNECVSLFTDRVLISVGLELNLSFLGTLVERDAKGQIIISQNNETSCAGIFAAGDATTIPFHQVVISAGEGAKAALSAYRFLQEKRGARSMLMDWEHT